MFFPPGLPFPVRLSAVRILAAVARSVVSDTGVLAFDVRSRYLFVALLATVKLCLLANVVEYFGELRNVWDQH